MILVALGRKELRQARRDPAVILVTTVLPVALLLIFGYGVNLDVGEFKIGLTIDRGKPSNVSLMTAFSNSRHFDVVVGDDPRQFHEELAAGRLRGLVAVQTDFDRLLSEGRAAPIQVVTDGSDANTAALVASYVQAVLRGWRESRAEEMGLRVGPPISLEPTVRYNPELSSRHFLLPGSISIIMTIIGVILTALVVSREWERGTMESLLASPASIRQILLAKFLTFFALSQISLALCWVMTTLWFDVPFRGSLVALFACGAFFLVGALGQGLTISTITRSQYQAAELALITGFLPSFLLSGVIFEIASMPTALRAIARFIPARHFVDCLQTVFLTGDVWPLFLSAMARMGLIGLLFSAVIVAASRRKAA